MNIKKLSHIMIFIQDSEKMAKFYTDILGLSVGEMVDNYIFFHNNGEDHHILAFALNTEKTNHFEHISFEVESIEVLNDYIQKLVQNNIHYEKYDYRIGICVYFPDPENNWLELFVDLRKERNIEKWDGTFDKIQEG